MAKITEYPAATSFDSGDILIKDGTNGTKKISVDNASVNFIEIANQTVSSSQIAELDDCVLITNDTDGVRKMLVADISGNAHSRELTYSQYQALSNAEKTNGTTYYVTDDPNDRVGGGINYSTEEQDTGLLWIDGRHIYQKSFTRTNQAYGGGMTFDTGVSNMDVLINDRWCIYGALNVSKPVTAEGEYIRCQHNGNGILTIGSSAYNFNSAPNRTWTLTIWYTKSTS